ncbi:tRNA lysidine(34) synthetase TilS [Yokenella regensburgei]|jgi:tRNA(Ile)-lysidine synthase|uniref:tRNA lysidine(34) synthetase TilS n=1 Tax=Yokenella regensburgei TaxID=158877 RepID=UPI00024211A4|nr:tRNA lysidine(34) synthetase TilS [Yokenella regensburgei]EHM51332.1 tRNA(Ile)-lysidine synthetase [Yokenella regensburgei ATCC 43003]MDQ4429200.1 tRNA lysidine(34) synthetase TilS [Yokenella regensburgei]
MKTPEIAHSLAPRQRFLVAFSGGLDSTVLLHQLMCWRQQNPAIQLRAIHIHHGLSANADDWVIHCQQLCQQWDIPLEVVRVTLVDEGKGIEAHAREARYAAFRTSLREGEALVTAQHQNDQCETFLLALKRGSGPAGLSAMPTVADFAGSELLRPLLNCSRDELLTWAQQHNLSWIEDESNQDDAYDRNFLRLRVVPVLTRRWPHFAQAVARSAALCGEQEQLLDELLAAELSALVTDEGTLLLAPLESMSAVKRAALLRRWLSMHTRQMPSREMLGRIWQEVAQAREDAAPCLRLGDFEIRRYQQQLWWLPLQQRYAEAIFPWGDISEPLILPSAMGALALEPGGTLRAPAHDEVVTIRFKASGVLHIVGRQGGRKLKKIWQELGVAPWRRDTTPLLFYGETLIAAAGVFVTREGLADEGQGLALTWRKNGQ